MGTAVKQPVPDRVEPSFVIFDIWALWRSGLIVSARMSKITNDGLTRCGTGCFVAVLAYDSSELRRVKSASKGSESCATNFLSVHLIALTTSLTHWSALSLHCLAASYSTHTYYPTTVFTPFTVTRRHVPLLHWIIYFMVLLLKFNKRVLRV